MKREPRRSAKFRSKKSMKCKFSATFASFALVEFRSAPRRSPSFLFRRPSHRSARTSIVPSPPFRVHTRFDEKGAPGDGSPVERGTSACFAARRTICLSQGRGPWKREVRASTLPRPSSHLPLSFSSSSYVPNEAARWIDSPPRMRLCLLPSTFILPLSSPSSCSVCPRIEQEHRSPPAHE